jgi:hypothetical protein
MWRSYLLFGDVALTQERDLELLAEHMAYSSLSPGEFIAAVICWLPGIGGGLSTLLLSPATARKFDLYYEGSLLLEALPILTAVQRPAGGDAQAWRVLQSYALGDPVGYAAASALLILRGMRVTGSLFVLWGLLALPLLWRRLSASRKLGPFLLVGGPLFAMAIVQGLLSSNLPWMNLPLLFVYAYAIAGVTGGIELPIGLRRFLWRHNRN